MDVGCKREGGYQDNNVNPSGLDISIILSNKIISIELNMFNFHNIEIKISKWHVFSRQLDILV